jgi:predicted dehydrogenase
MKTLLIGLGVMGSNHFRVLKMLLPKNEILIYDKNKKILNSNLKNNKIKQSKSLNTLLSISKKVIIATPTSTHFNLIKQSIKLGVKYIFVEKPLVKSLHESKKIINLVKKNNVELNVGLIERFNSIFIPLQKILKKEKIINLDLIRTARVIKRNKDVDVVLDLMLHDIDIALKINGDIKKIIAFGFKKNNLIETASVNLIHKNNSFSRLYASRITDKKVRELKVLTTKFYVEANLLEREFSIYKNSTYNQGPKKLYKVSNYLEKIQSLPTEPLFLELDFFLNKKIENKIYKQKDLNEEYHHKLLLICEKIKKQIK